MIDVTTIATARADDLETVVELAVAFREHQEQSWPSAEEFRAAFAVLLGDPATEILVARGPAGESRGYLVIRYRHNAWVPGECAELEDVFVHPDARRGGIGRRLVERAIERTEARGCRLVSLTTNERNDAALQLYEQFGFRAERARWRGGRALWLERWRDGE